MGTWSRIKDSVEDSLGTYVGVLTGEKSLKDITDDDLMDPGSAAIEALTGVNVNAFAGFGSENDFFEKPWTDRDIDFVGAVFPAETYRKVLNGEYSKEDVYNPGSTVWNPLGQG